MPPTDLAGNISGGCKSALPESAAAEKHECSSLRGSLSGLGVSASPLELELELEPEQMLDDLAFDTGSFPAFRSDFGSLCN